MAVAFTLTAWSGWIPGTTSRASAQTADVSISHTGPDGSPIQASGPVDHPAASAYWPKAPASRSGGISRIAPVQANAVTPPEPLPMSVEVSGLDAQCAVLRRETAANDAPAAGDAWDRLLAEQCAKQEQDWLMADLAPDPVYVLGLQTAPRPVINPMGGLDYKPAGRKPMLRPMASRGGTQYTERNIVRRQADGPSVAFGSVLTRAPAWTDPTRIGGVQLSDWGEGRLLEQGDFGYSTMVGVLDYTDAAALSGAYQYGSTVGSSSMRYGLTPGVTLESHIESGPSLVAMGVGSTYSLGVLGEVQAGTTQSEYAQHTAQRHRLGYSVSLLDAVDVGVVTEQIGQGYNDLADFRSGAASQNQVRNTFSTGVPLGQYGTLSTTYTGLRGGGEYLERRYGFNHQVALSPTVAVGVGADRDVVSGDYAMHMSLAMPVDAFLGRLRLFR